ncbi:MAG TPA: AAA family ATPase, partial [Acidobacteriota bacterium]|nr:AAA family ATPase [Acidobacteriota bacterium]
MITRLRISNFALLEEIEIDFDQGLSLFTGETGAGKSILIDAICGVLGARMSQDDVRSGATKSVIEVVFDSSDLTGGARKLLETWQIDSAEPELILRREIQSSGKTRALINNCTVTLQQLRALAPHLVDVFGQSEHQSLLDPESQRALYDESAGIELPLQELR